MNTVKRSCTIALLLLPACSSASFEIPPDEQTLTANDGDAIGFPRESGGGEVESDTNVPGDFGVVVDTGTVAVLDAGVEADTAVAPPLDTAPEATDTASAPDTAPPADTMSPPKGEKCERYYAVDDFCSDTWATGKGPTSVYNGGCLTTTGGPCFAWTCPSAVKHPVNHQCEDRWFSFAPPTGGKMWCCRDKFAVHQQP